MKPVRSPLPVPMREAWHRSFKIEKAHLWIKALAFLLSEKQYYPHFYSFSFPVYILKLPGEESFIHHFLCWSKNYKKKHYFYPNNDGFLLSSCVGSQIAYSVVSHSFPKGKNPFKILLVSILSERWSFNWELDFRIKICPEYLSILLQSPNH